MNGGRKNAGACRATEEPMRDNVSLKVPSAKYPETALPRESVPAPRLGATCLDWSGYWSQFSPSFIAI